MRRGSGDLAAARGQSWPWPSLGVQPDLLILDEPTNHMDFHGAERLVEMRTFPGATLIISHDRWFLDQVVKRLTS